MKNNYAQQLAWFEKEELPHLVKEVQKPSGAAVSHYASSKPAPLLKRTLSKDSDPPSLNSLKDTSVVEREPLDNIENRKPFQKVAATGMCL
jgi:hypothetical protein